MRKAVFLDRDGVMNEMVYDPEFGTVDSPSRPDQVRLRPGVGAAIARLNALGLPVVVITNQPGLAKGKLSRALLESVAARVQENVEEAGGRVDAVYTCMHHPEATAKDLAVDCDCRKPKSGLLLRAASDLDLDLSQSYMVGDGVTDVVAGQRVGATTLFVNSRKAYLAEALQHASVWPTHFVSDLNEAVDLIAAREARVHQMSLASGTARSASDSETAGYVSQYVSESIQVLERIDQSAIEAMVDLVVATRESQGRLFFLGVGGGAGHASHAVNDFRKIAGMEAYTPTDNVSELTARINDDGWETSFARWLEGSRLSDRDLVFVFSVGGGDLERNISANLVRALELAKERNAAVCGIVGRDGGYTAQVADACVVIPTVNPSAITPHTEGFQAVIWHLIVSHPRLLASAMKWESSGS